MRTTSAARALAAVLLLGPLTSGCTAPSPDGPPPASGGDTPTDRVRATLPTPPDGARWIGAGTVVLAVPREWRSGDPCVTSRSEGALRLAPRDEPCATAGRAVSSLAVAPATGGAVALGRRVDLAASAPGVELATSGIECDRTRRSCRSTFVPLAAGAGPSRLVFDVRTSGPRARAAAQDVLDSVRRLPAGLRAVPAVDVYGPPGPALRVLRAAGLDGVDPDVGFPHYVIGTRPSPGTVVPVGSAVRLRVGDG